jgi:two-component system, chemotaxis family, chemotaxis protein CheY
MTSRLTALVIDDQEMMRSIIRTALKRLNITQVLEAASGLAAIEILRNAKPIPDFIFCDLYMDHGGGTDFINRMRRDDFLKTLNIPILMLTGEDDPMMLDVCRQVGAAMVLKKPCSVPQIASALSKILGYNVAPATAAAL